MQHILARRLADEVQQYRGALDRRRDEVPVLSVVLVRNRRLPSYLEAEYDLHSLRPCKGGDLITALNLNKVSSLSVIAAGYFGVCNLSRFRTASAAAAFPFWRP